MGTGKLSSGGSPYLVGPVVVSRIHREVIEGQGFRFFGGDRTISSVDCQPVQDLLLEKLLLPLLTLGIPQTTCVA